MRIEVRFLQVNFPQVFPNARMEMRETGAGSEALNASNNSGNRVLSIHAVRDARRIHPLDAEICQNDSICPPDAGGPPTIVSQWKESEGNAINAIWGGNASCDFLFRSFHARFRWDLFIATARMSSSIRTAQRSARILDAQRYTLYSFT